MSVAPTTWYLSEFPAITYCWYACLTHRNGLGVALIFSRLFAKTLCKASWTLLHSFSGRKYAVVISVRSRKCSAAIFCPFNCHYTTVKKKNILKKNRVLCEKPRKYVWERLAIQTKSWHVASNFHGFSCAGRQFSQG